MNLYQSLHSIFGINAPNFVFIVEYMLVEFLNQWGQFRMLIIVLRFS